MRPGHRALPEAPATPAGAAHHALREYFRMHKKALFRSATAVLAAGGLATGLAVTLAGPAQAAVSWPAHVFAPYVDTGLSNTTLTSVAADYGTKYFTLAFVDGSGCQWSLPNQSGWQSQISSLQAEGGDVSVSFGGYTVDTNGTDLGATCSSASAMATQVESVVTTLGVTHLDFDIESSELTNSTDVVRTAQALALVRSWGSANGKSLSITYTIPSATTGLTSDGVTVLNDAHSNGFTPDIVNIMTMDYGTSGTEMGSAADSALDGTASQVASAFGVSSSAAYAMLGNTPMIGQNDSSGEIFSLADASTVESYAAQKGIALLSFWSEGRDNGGCPGQTSASSTCSGVSQSTGQFTQIFQAFSGGASSTGSSSPTASASPSPTATSTGSSGGSCAAAWSSSTAYSSGNEVSYNCDNWTANQWNYDEVPGGASGAWNNDGAC
jgi:Glycosyl hydrolases family 18